MKNQGFINHSAQGNAFIFILITIALLAALTISVTRMSSTSSDVSIEQAQTIATQVVRQGQSVSTAVDGLRAKGCAIQDISFENSIVSGYANVQSPADKSCWVFNPFDPAGAGMAFPKPPTSANDGSDWFFPRNNAVAGVGPEREDGVACTNNCQELMIILPLVDVQVCKAINVLTGVMANLDSPMPQDATTFDYRYKFSASSTLPTNSNFSASSGTGSTLSDANTSGTAGRLWDKTAGCFEAINSYEDPSGATQAGIGKYFFYQVLAER